MAVRVLRRPDGAKARPEDYFRQHRQRDREKPATYGWRQNHRDVFRFCTLDELKTWSWTTMRKTALLVLARRPLRAAFATRRARLTAGFRRLTGALLLKSCSAP